MSNQQEVSLQTAVSDKLLSIPDYQRPYAWEDGQLRDLWEDLDVLGPHGRHYTGTLVLLPNGDPPVHTAFGQTLTPTDVVDGQQRLTTCLILVDRIRREFERLAQDGVEDAGDTATHLREMYGLVKVHATHRPRLQLGKEFNSFWADTILGAHQASISKPTAGHQRLKCAADFFDDKIVDLTKGADPSTADGMLRDLLTRVTDGLKFLVYEVDSAAEVGVIFETLNGRGRPLSELEKIKNYLLYLIRALPGDRAEQLGDLINSAWAGIFTDLAGLGVDEDRLLRSHWLATQNPDARSWAGAAAIKSVLSRATYVPHSDRLGGHPAGDSDEPLAEVDGGDIEAYVRTLRLCALFLKETFDPGAAFSNFASHQASARSHSGALVRSRNVATFLPVIFACRLKYPDDGLAYGSLLQACETYAARVFTISQRRANAGQSTLYRLAYRLLRGELTVPQVTDEVKALAWSYADDDRVRNSLSLNEDWYHRRGHKYFLYEYELDLLPTGAVQPDYADFTGTHYEQTTEHILPQKPAWERDDWAEYVDRGEHLELLHSLGNLVLTLDNSSYSNKEFAAKKGKLGSSTPCYATSSLQQERAIARYTQWGRGEMEDRLEKLRVFALQRWPLQAPTTDVATAIERLLDSSAVVDDDDDPDATDGDLSR